MTLPPITLATNSFEPSRYSSNNIVRWKNPKLLPILTRSIDEAKELLVGLRTDNDVANILEIPVGQLLYILYSQEKNYKTFFIKKKSGKNRSIDSPSKSVKILQEKIKPLIEAHYRVKKPVHGFVGGGKGIVSNAEQHKKKNYVLNIDLQDFFHSINFGRVQGIFKNTPFNMATPAASVLAQLCTHNGRLPQGACTSPLISNLAATSLDKKLVQIAKKFHLTYTRYADDLTFSSNKPLPSILVEKIAEENGKYRYKVGRVIEQAIIDSGFNINHNKMLIDGLSEKLER